ncbi:hypothetical protein DI09_127p60 [Mitosporidium daphniae]|uniref:Uncharacterized protein n=1 Tax=Mitosporidium daphniae TaxID=1485682 RepID=A0A098VVH7_9MICR|nr:uncharacterized protein DI09_127p60 [Mitosporidium daphniae]KGG52900.1 hypothetical protein DI09_127p60 [Mitosporidium daphniae]|eukprot:XP_013239336.1 uncharacterized protein DI09_127p60 [Mitosporidium daphniae]
MSTQYNDPPMSPYGYHDPSKAPASNQASPPNITPPNSNIASFPAQNYHQAAYQQPTSVAYFTPNQQQTYKQQSYQQQPYQPNSYQPQPSQQNDSHLHSAPHVTPSGSEMNYPQQQTQKLDQRQIPNPVSVRSQDQELFYSTGYFTSSTQPIPLSSTDCVYIDDCGISTPSFIRPTIKDIPTSEDILKSSSLSIGLVIQPFSLLSKNEAAVPLIESGPKGPIRCDGCRAYMNPFMKFIDHGRKFKCNLCQFDSIVPDEYFCNLDATGKRCDISSRPELHLGTIDMTVTQDYCNRTLSRPKILFLIDVSLSSIQCGLAQTAINSISYYIQCILSMDGSFTRSPIGIMAYDKDIHFYICKDTESGAKSIELISLSDLEDPFLPVNSESIFSFDSNDDLKLYPTKRLIL